jgi:hypothetical protein
VGLSTTVFLPVESASTTMPNGASGSVVPAYKKTPFVFEFSLCLSRACLGKMMHFTIKMKQKWRFLTSADQSARQLAAAGKKKKRKQHPFSVSSLPFLSVPSLSWQIIVFCFQEY